MFGNPFMPQYMPCPDCGASVHQNFFRSHQCNPERKLDFQMVQLKPEIDSFDKGLWSFLLSNQGEFEVYYAQYQRLRAA